MIAAHEPVQRPANAKLLMLDACGGIRHLAREGLVSLLRHGDLVIANDAATLPASLHGVHERTGRPIEVRLAQRKSLDPDDVHEFVAVIFGEGDYHTRTEDRAPPPRMRVGDLLVLGPLRATVVGFVNTSTCLSIRFEGSAQSIWAGLANHGRPIQYAHMLTGLQLWDVWTPIAGMPAAFEPPSAGFALDWKSLAEMRERGIEFATLTHAAGISSTGDEVLDRMLPLDEPYRIPQSTAQAIARAKARGSRIIAVGTTVVRALESAATKEGAVKAGPGLATQRLGPRTRLRIVDAILSGTHDPGTSHYELLGAFAERKTLEEADAALERHGYRTHEFGDSVLIEKRGNCHRGRIGEVSLS